MYKSIYGRNRVERAILMYKNIPPIGYEKPQPGTRTFRALGITAKFTDDSAYVENFDNKQMSGRKFIIVRSQKFTVSQPRYYIIKILGTFMDLVSSNRPAMYLGYCSCKDYNKMCKHKRAITYVIQGNTYDFRAGDEIEILSLNFQSLKF